MAQNTVKSQKGIYGLAKAVLLVTALYDLVLGIAFLFFYAPIFSWLLIELPTDARYLQLSAAFVLVLGIGYYLIYRNIERNKDLFLLGILYKVAYSAIAFYYFFFGTVETIFFIFGCIDLVMLALLVYCYKKIYNG